MIEGRLGKGFGDGVRVVLQYPEIGHGTAQVFQKGHHGIAVGIVNAAFSGFGAGVADFVAGRKHRRA